MSKETSAKAVMQTPKIIPTKWAKVAVYGWENISQKMLEVFSMLLNLPFWEDGDHGIRTINLGDVGLRREVDGEIKYPLAECWPEGQTVVMDLENTFNNAVRRCEKDQPSGSFFAWYTLSLFLSLLHEAHHLGAVAADGTDINVDEEESAAEAFAHDALLDIAKQFMVEPDEWINEPYFRDTVLGDRFEGRADDWLVHQVRMLDNRLFFHLRESDGVAVKCHTFKDYLHLVISGDEPNDETWLNTPVPTAPIAKAVADIGSGETVATEAVETMAKLAPTADVITLPAEDVVMPVADNVYYEGIEDELFGDMPESMLGTGVYEATQGGYANQQAPFVPSGNTQPQPMQVASPEVNVYSPTSMDDPTLIGVVQGLYFKIYNHIFGYCGAGASGFSHPSKVYELALELTPQEAEAVVSMDCLDPNGRWCPRMSPKRLWLDGKTRARLSGAETKNTKLPYYKLYINANGKELCRMLIPQNPLKQTNGAFSKPALAAQSGSRIMYVMEGNDDIARAGGKKFIGKIVDGSWGA